MIHCAEGCTPYDAGVNLLFTPTPAAELRAIREAGFDHVRQPFNPATVNVPELAAMVRAARQAGLVVIVDAHPRPQLRDKIEKDPATRRAYFAMWREVVSEIPADGVLFELMNEPVSPAWWSIQGRMIRDLRPLTNAPFVANAPGMASVWDLMKRHPYKIRGVVYNFHFYSPMSFTHQGAPWNKTYSKVSGVTYPGAGWDAERIQKTMDAARQWSKANRVPVTCNEYGAWKMSPDRKRYVADVSAALKRSGIGRTIWNEGGFAVPYNVVLRPGG